MVSGAYRRHQQGDHDPPHCVYCAADQAEEEEMIDRYVEAGAFDDDDETEGQP